MARELGMGLDECMEKHTERQMILWMLYLNEDMDRPGKNESYLMRLGLEVRLLNERVRTLFGGKMVEPKMEDFKLAFNPPTIVQPKTKEEAAGIAKSVWTAHLGVEIIHKTRTRTEARALGLIE